jgi:cytoskeletal protein RodZ
MTTTKLAGINPSQLFYFPIPGTPRVHPSISMSDFWFYGLIQSMADTQLPQKNGKKKRGVTFSPIGFVIFLVLILSLMGFFAWQAGYLDQWFPPDKTAGSLPTQPNPQNPTQENSVSATSSPTEEAVPQPQIPTLPPQGDGTLPGLIVFSMNEAGYSHLYAYHPETLPLTRLTYGEWDDRNPAINPDGTTIAFTSNRSGHWDIYLLDLTTGETTQFTDDLPYDGHPSWSSDGLWLAYEKYVDQNLDIYIKPLVAEIQETRLTTNPSQDFEPAWQPGTTNIAFTSTRTGSQDIFWVNPNQSDEPVNYTNNHTTNQIHPTWSTDGSQMAWTSFTNGYSTLFSVEINQEAASAKPALNTNLFAWDPTGTYLVSIQNTPDQYFLSIVDASDFSYILLPTELPGPVDDISWGLNMLPPALPAQINQAAKAEPQAPWKEKLLPSTGALYGRQNIIDLPDIKAPHPALSALAVEPFYALKDQALLRLGWDVLSDLENMFVSIAQPLPPGRENDWLYTGRAFSLNPILIDYEYMTVIREDYGPKTYWRVYLKPLDQSGNQGAPLTRFPWDFDSRYSGSPSAYEAGGEQFSEIPAGYWVDFSALAMEYGWERQFALNNWQSYYQGARFNVFVITSGLTWEDAMLQVWPPEVFQRQDSP